MCVGGTPKNKLIRTKDHENILYEYIFEALTPKTNSLKMLWY